MKVKMILPALTEATSPFWRPILRHAAYSAGWKKFEPCWDFVIRAKRAGMIGDPNMS
jgi:hypothetical protein